MVFRSLIQPRHSPVLAQSSRPSSSTVPTMDAALLTCSWKTTLVWRDLSSATSKPKVRSQTGSRTRRRRLVRPMTSPST